MAEEGEAVSCIPSELVQHITGRLPLSALRSLCGTAKAFGQQPTCQFVTKLSIPASSLSCWSQRCPGRAGSLSHVAHVTITGSKQQPLMVLPQALPALHQQQQRLLHAAAQQQQYQALKAVEQVQLILFAVRWTPTMACLSRLQLHDISVDSLIAMAACLATARCPLLSRISVAGISAGAGTPAAGQSAPALSDLWPALAGITALRHFKLKGLLGAHLTSGLPGIGAIQGLQRLSLNNAAVWLGEMSRMPGLTQLTVGEVLREHLNDTAPNSLQHLRFAKDVNVAPHAQADAAAFATCHLNSFKLNAYLNPGLPLETLLPASFASLTHLDFHNRDLSFPQLLAMPLLRSLLCTTVDLPLAGAGLSHPSITFLHCCVMRKPVDGSTDIVPLQPVAATFPHLTKLVFFPFDDADFASAGNSPWRATPTGPRPLALRILTVSVTGLTLPLAQSAVAVDHLTVAWARSGPAVDPVCTPALLLFGPRLLRVELSMSGLDDHGLVALLGSWTRVEDVTLSGRSSFTDLALAALSRLPRLRRVTLVSCCAGVTPAGIASLASRWLVEYVEVCACPGVSAAGLARVEGLLGRPQLSLVYSATPKKLP